jgi:hypothetical protein
LPGVLKNVSQKFWPFSAHVQIEDDLFLTRDGDGKKNFEMFLTGVSMAIAVCAIIPQSVEKCGKIYTR